MCFAPQRRALFWHVNFQKWSENGVFCTFWLGNVLRTTTACTFSTSQLPKMFRDWRVLYILASKCASHHNGVRFLTSQLPKVLRDWRVSHTLTWKRASRHKGAQFCISHLARWLCTWRFSEPTFRPSSFATLLPFRAPASSFFSLFLSFLTFSPLLFTSLTLSTSAFPPALIAGSLTSKRPSINQHMIERQTIRRDRGFYFSYLWVLVDSGMHQVPDAAWVSETLCWPSLTERHLCTLRYFVMQQDKESRRGHLPWSLPMCRRSHNAAMMLCLIRHYLAPDSSCKKLECPRGLYARGGIDLKVGCWNIWNL